ncbi:peptidase M13 [Acetobacteraceae bacterium KSS8]|uniref:Peptidase M13 n=1 Tax=Endosaccharibacter trunci TaxID=2812733 RepID=A0ABT1W5Z5_9PROT|nr:peptidase M13 [Acetobacteraceae bacterium KSS8]
MAAPSGAARADTGTPPTTGWGFDMAGRDTAIRPGDNFFGYADGTAVREMVIPPDRTSWGAFNILAERSRERVQTILREAAAKSTANPGTDEAKLGAFFDAFMDEKTIESRGTAPMQADLDAIRAVSDRTKFAALNGQAQNGLQYTLFALSISPDAKDPTQYAVTLGQGGTGLPDRDYYLKPEFAAKKTAYQSYIAQMLGLIGWQNPDKNAADIVAFETKLAQAQWARQDDRDPDKTYNPTTLADLEKAAPQFDWHAYFTAAGLPNADKLVLVEKSAVLAEARIAGETDLDTLRAWLAFHLADNAADVLPKRFVDAAFAFHGKTLSGQPELEARWKRAVSATSGAMGWAIGKIYVARYFPPSAKAAMETLTADLKSAFRVRLEHNSWMSPQTRQAALVKLENHLIQIGYPNKWRDYSGLVVKPDDAYGNTERATAFEWAFWLGHQGKTVDRDEWDMTPQTVNAYNNPPFDEVVFPAAILQPPFFDPKADPAINFGAIGGVIGHEMTHSFDDEGRKFDEHGRLHDWWTEADAKRFEERAARLGAQFDALEPFPGLHVNGKLTMGENIADLGGLTLALDAYHAFMKGKTAPVIDGLTGDQRVFLGWAQVWRQKVRPDRAKMLLVTDPHSPPMARVNMPMHNIDGWYKAWNVKPGDKLYLAPKDRVQIW